ncbi:uncharacterized protein LOC112506184 [Cynara cardunculus var. scolymus]|uniref:uncharacterized protein LOC112506184 n=1 Tax=Cynara cardunculus var. scolymus TaxID=59895 RepID=UPI000D624541|nr:uncharacterized protein LOC112506184 [Cynara cardunculus var. scolymus]
MDEDVSVAPETLNIPEDDDNFDYEEIKSMKVKKPSKHRYEVVCHSNSDCDWHLMVVSIDGTSMFQESVPCEIMEDVNQRFNISISYHQAWRAKMYVLQLLRGTPESLFNLLPIYCHNLKLANSGTVTEIALDGLGRFDMLFVALSCSIRSFLGHMRPLLIMDSVHLKGPYVGTMFLAVGMDGNNGIVPITIGVEKIESGPSWTWFLRKLRQYIGDMPNLTFITDRAASIDLAIQTVFSSAHHGLCCPHLIQNLRLNSTKEKSKRWMFWEACKVYRLSDFEATMDLMWQSLPIAAQFLEEVGYARWARSHFLDCVTVQ